MQGVIIMKGQLNDEAVQVTGSKRWPTLARNFGISFMAAIFTGIIFGLLLRLVMGIIAYFFPHMASGFSFSGTFIILVVGIAGTLANSIVYTLVFQSSSKSWVRKGFYYGVVSLIIYGIPLFLSNPNNELFGPQAPLGIGLFSGLFFAGAFLLAFFIELVTNWIDRSKRRVKLAYVSFAILVIPAAVILVNIFLEIFYEMLPKIIDNFS